MKTKISVTNIEIEYGRRASMTHCPIALAIRRSLPHSGFYDVRVVGEYVECRCDGQPVFADLPQVARDFIENFDAEDHVDPISFDVEWSEMTPRKPRLNPQS